MVKRRNSTNSNESYPQLELLFSRFNAEEKLLERINKGKEFRKRDFNSEQEFDQLCNDKKKWTDYNIELLSRMFNTREVAEEYDYSRGSLTVVSSFQSKVRNFSEDLYAKIASLESIIERLELIPEKDNEAIKAPSKSPIKVVQSQNKDIFIVHGQDNGVKESVARLLTSLGLNPIILHEQPNGGATIIEKFENSTSNIGYAVVVMTPDDIGFPKNYEDQAKPRARQNVIFELGYFIGKLGRSKVCVLFKDVEIPSDYNGAVYIPLDTSDTWKYLLAKEIKSMGAEVNVNALF